MIGLYDSFRDTIVSDDEYHKESHKVNYEFIVCIKLLVRDGLYTHSCVSGGRWCLSSVLRIVNETST